MLQAADTKPPRELSVTFRLLLTNQVGSSCTCVLLFASQISSAAAHCPGLQVTITLPQCGAPVASQAAAATAAAHPDGSGSRICCLSPGTSCCSHSAARLPALAPTLVYCLYRRLSLGPQCPLYNNPCADIGSAQLCRIGMADFARVEAEAEPFPACPAVIMQCALHCAACGLQDSCRRFRPVCCAPPKSNALNSYGRSGMLHCFDCTRMLQLTLASAGVTKFSIECGRVTSS